MQRSAGPAPAHAGLIARQMVWCYRPQTQVEGTENYFTALAPAVSEAIRAAILQPQQQVWVGREVHLRIGAYTIQARLENIEPVLATLADAQTQIIPRVQEASKDGRQSSSFLAETIRYPNDQAEEQLNALVAIDEIKADLYRKLALLVGPHFLDSWVHKQYGEAEPQGLLQVLRSRYPLVLLEGDVGSGKTALARSIGQRVATKLAIPVVLFVVSTQVRGGGHVGELTQNITKAFEEAERCEQNEQIATLILVDEADSLAQARGANQTHHEDDAGVNTLIQRIDRLRGRRMAVIFVTNLARSIDSAILRRAVAAYHFSRPDAQQRAALLQRVLAGTNLSDKAIAELVHITEPRQVPGFGKESHRYTYSDITQRLIPTAVEMSVWQGEPLTFEILRQAGSIVLPTPEMPA